MHDVFAARLADERHDLLMEFLERLFITAGGLRWDAHTRDTQRRPETDRGSELTRRVARGHCDPLLRQA